jgi:hypothetical protein
LLKNAITDGELVADITTSVQVEYGLVAYSMEYAVIEDPPLAGALQDTVDWPLVPLVPETPVGAPGTVAGVAPADAAEDAPVPMALVAAATKV